MNSEKVTISKNDLQELIIYAQRYVIGRTMMVPSAFRGIILMHLDNLTDNTINVVIRDIERKFDRDDLGFECDKELWVDLLLILKTEMQKREKK